MSQLAPCLSLPAAPHFTRISGNRGPEKEFRRTGGIRPEGAVGMRNSPARRSRKVGGEVRRAGSVEGGLATDKAGGRYIAKDERL